MSSNEVKHAKSASPARPRHQITRSITELSSPIRLHRHHHHLQPHQHPSERDRDDKNTASQPTGSILPSRASLDVPRSSGMTPNLSPDASRRTSVLVPSEDKDLASVSLQRDAIRVSPEQEALMARERITGKFALKKSLVDLNQSSVTTTERLNMLYSSILEKLSVLRSTVTALWELAGLSQEVKQSFARESRELVSEVETQLSAFGRFEEQQRLIEGLQERIQRGRGRIAILSARIDSVCETVEGWERADKDWQERTRKRLRVIWIITSVIIFSGILLILTAQYAGPALEEATMTFANESLSILRNQTNVLQGSRWDSDKEKEAITPARSPNFTSDFTTGGAAPTRQEMDLRIFDEL